jgi:tetratricopeptide (TPR) repeat protein
MKTKTLGVLPQTALKGPGPFSPLFQRIPCLALLFVTLLFLLTPLSLSFAAASSNTTLMERAKNLYSIQDYNNALTLFEKLLTMEPENGEAWDYASWCHRYLGNWNQARQGFERAETLLPGAEAKWVKVGLGETFLGAGQGGNSARAFSEAIELAPEDNELVVRSLKGLVLARASMGEAPQMEEALNRLKEKDAAAAEIIKNDATTLLEKNKPAEPGKNPEEDESPKPEPGELTDLSARQWLAAKSVVWVKKPASPEAQAAQDTVPKEPVNDVSVAEPTSSPEDEKTPEGKKAPLVVWGLPVGEPIQAAVVQLVGEEIEVQKNEEPTKFGSWFYTAKLPYFSSLLPELARTDADSALLILEEYQEKLLSISVTATWKERKNSISLKEELFVELSGKLGQKYGPSAGLNDNGIFAEAQWVPDDKRFIALEVTAGLDGQVVLNVSYSDLPGLSVFWEETAQTSERK